MNYGNYVAQVVIEGIDRHGNRVLRTAEHLLPFVQPALSLAGSRATAVAAKSATPRLTIHIPVTAPKNASHYRSYAKCGAAMRAATRCPWPGSAAW